jgi:hypothetical protein
MLDLVIFRFYILYIKKHCIEAMNSLEQWTMQVIFMVAPHYKSQISKMFLSFFFTIDVDEVCRWPYWPPWMFHWKTIKIIWKLYNLHYILSWKNVYIGNFELCLMPLFSYDWILYLNKSWVVDWAIQLWMLDYSNVIELQKWSLRV